MRRYVIEMVIKAVSAVVVCQFACLPVMAHEQEGFYIEEDEEYYLDELIPGGFYDGMYFDGFATDSDLPGTLNATLTAPIIYRFGGYGGYYMGELTVPSEITGLYNFDGVQEVIAISGIYKNGLTALYLPESVQYINSTINDCMYLEKVFLNNSLKRLEGVKNCPKLKECPLPLSLEWIGDGWMSGIAIEEVELPSGLTEIGKNVFCDNPNLAGINLGNLVIMGDSCFRYLPALKEIVLPETLTHYGCGCFNNCQELRKITLPSTGIDINGCFNKCPSIREVYVYAEDPYVFPNCSFEDTDLKECVLYVPEGSESAYSAALGWKDFGRIEGVSLSGIESSDDSDEWRVLPMKGKLLVDSGTERRVAVTCLSGQTMAEAVVSGRTEIILPSGIYIVSSGGRSVKSVVK